MTEPVARNDLVNVYNKAIEALTHRPDGDVQESLAAAIESLQQLIRVCEIDEAQRYLDRAQRDVQRYQGVIAVLQEGKP